MKKHGVKAYSKEGLGRGNVWKEHGLRSIYLEELGEDKSNTSRIEEVKEYLKKQEFEERKLFWLKYIVMKGYKVGQRWWTKKRHQEIEESFNIRIVKVQK